jgi:hypothetical protein
LERKKTFTKRKNKKKEIVGLWHDASFPTRLSFRKRKIGMQRKLLERACDPGSIPGSRIFSYTQGQSQGAPEKPFLLASTKYIRKEGQDSVNRILLGFWWEEGV